MNRLETQYQKLKTFSADNLLFILKVLVSSILISLTSWMSFKKPVLAGFLISLPIASLITILFSYLEHKNFEKTVVFAKSIFIGVPISLLFFVPFIFSKHLNLIFIQTYLSGILILVIGYFIHKYLTNLL